jgi:hypothetical protein
MFGAIIGCFGHAWDMAAYLGWLGTVKRVVLPLGWLGKAGRRGGGAEADSQRHCLVLDGDGACNMGRAGECQVDIGVHDAGPRDQAGVGGRRGVGEGGR